MPHKTYSCPQSWVVCNFADLQNLVNLQAFRKYNTFAICGLQTVVRKYILFLTKIAFNALIQICQNEKSPLKR
jgi:hypothetical protein